VDGSRRKNEETAESNSISEIHQVSDRVVLWIEVHAFPDLEREIRGAHCRA
jgi:hypothetical protein